MRLIISLLVSAIWSLIYVSVLYTCSSILNWLTLDCTSLNLCDVINRSRLKIQHFYFKTFRFKLNIERHINKNEFWHYAVWYMYYCYIAWLGSQLLICSLSGRDKSEVNDVWKKQIKRFKWSMSSVKSCPFFKIKFA